MVLVVKNPLAIMEDIEDVGSSLNQEDPPRRRHSNPLQYSWSISPTEEPVKTHSLVARVGHDCSHVALSTHCTVDSGHHAVGCVLLRRKGGFVLLVAEWIVVLMGQCYFV